MIITGDTFADVLKTVQGMYDLQVKKADENTLAIQKVEPCKQLVHFGSDSLNFKSYYSGSGRVPETSDEWDSQLEKFKAECAKELDRLAALHAANEPIIAHNQKVSERIKIFMKATGIPDSRAETDYGTGRRRSTPKTNWVPAGYFGDISRNVTLSDGYEHAVRGVKEAEAKAIERVKTAKAALVQAERQKAADEAKRKADMVIVHMRVKYGAGVEDDAGEVLDRILEKNQHLRLAHFMCMNRGDWNEGPSYARQGLAGFKPETALDHEIYDAVQAACDDWQGDGRVFRDMEHNYGTIFALVDDDALMADYNTVNEMYQRERY